MQNLAKKPVTCGKCGLEFKTAQGLNGHLRFKHGIRSQLTSLEERIKRAKSLHGQGWPLAEIGRDLGVSKSTAKNYIDGYPYKGEEKESRTNTPHPEKVLEGFFDGLEGLVAEVQELRRQRDEWKKKAEEWASRVVALQELLARKD